MYDFPFIELTILIIINLINISTSSKGKKLTRNKKLELAMMQVLEVNIIYIGAGMVLNSSVFLYINEATDSDFIQNISKVIIYIILYLLSIYLYKRNLIKNPLDKHLTTPNKLVKKYGKRYTELITKPSSLALTFLSLAFVIAFASSIISLVSILF